MERQKYIAEVYDLVICSEGVEKVNNVSEQELKVIMKKHNNKVNGSDGRYTIYDKAKARLYLYLYIKENLKTVKIDIRPKVVAYSGYRRITQQFKKKLKACLPKVMLIERDEKGKWQLCNNQTLLDAVKEAMEMK